MGPRLRGDDTLIAASSEFSLLTMDGSAFAPPPLLHAQRDEAQFAVAVGDQQQHGFLAVLLQLIDALLDVGGVGHRFLGHLDDDVAGGQALVGGIRSAVDAGDDDALDAVLDLVSGAQILAQGRKIETQRLLGHRLLRRLVLGLGSDLHLVGILQPAERDLVGLLLALADDDDVDLLADRGVGHDARQVFRLLDILVVELDDDVAGFDAGRLGRSLVFDACDQGAARRLDVEALGDLVRHGLDAHAEPAAAKFAELLKLRHHAGDRLGGHGKADADRAAGGRNDQRVDADDFAVEVEQRTAGIAAIDRGVGLDVAVVGAGRDIAVLRRDDARGHRATEAERIADRDYPFAEPELVGIAELHRRQLPRRLELQHRQIGLLVDADDVGLDLGAVIHDDVDLVGVGDDVVVGDDDAGGIDDEAGAERVGLARLQIAATALAAATAVLEEVVEKFLERRPRRQLRDRAAAAVTALGLDGLRGRDIDDRVDHLLGDIG